MKPTLEIGEFSQIADAGSNGFEIQEYSRTYEALCSLRDKYQDVSYPVETSRGMEAAKAARAELRTLRIDLEKMRKDIKAPALTRCQLIDSEARTITGQIVALEDPIDEQIKYEEFRKEHERRAIEEAENARLRAAAELEAAERQAELDRKNAEIEAMRAELAAIQAERAARQEAARLEAEAEARRLEQARQAEIRAAHDAEMKRQAAEIEARRIDQERLYAEQDRIRREQQAELDRQAAEARAERERLARESAELRAAEQSRYEAEERAKFAEAEAREKKAAQKAAAELAHLNKMVGEIAKEPGMEAFIEAAYAFRNSECPKEDMVTLFALCTMYREAQVGK